MKLSQLKVPIIELEFIYMVHKMENHIVEYKPIMIYLE